MSVIVGTPLIVCRSSADYRVPAPLQRLHKRGVMREFVLITLLICAPMLVLLALLTTALVT